MAEERAVAVDAKSGCSTKESRDGKEAGDEQGEIHVSGSLEGSDRIVE